MQKISFVCLAALTVLVTGCPHNDYTIELTPRGQAVERRLDFYRADGADSNGVPKYESFPTNELAAITALYPAGAVTHQGERHSASGEFSGALPGDVGGAGEYHFYSSSLGDSGFYVERFRGTNDLAVSAGARLTAADQITDLVIGWTRAEFGREPGYKNLRRFLDTNFRHDLKNFSLYFWAGGIAATENPDAPVEFTLAEFKVRLGQYLAERGYFKIGESPELVRDFFDIGDAAAVRLVQKLLAEKLGMPWSDATRRRLALLGDTEALDKSWKKFLAGTPAYRAQLRQWETARKTQPDLEQPEPSKAVGELFETLIEPGSSGDDDHLTVRLKLASAPDHTNGKWDKAGHQVVWQANLDVRESGRRLPAFCYANWSRPEEKFQQAHFGRVLINGDDLLKYCLWRGGLEPNQAAEWEKFLSVLPPGEALEKALEDFRFADGSHAADAGKELLTTALGKKP